MEEYFYKDGEMKDVLYRGGDYTFTSSDDEYEEDDNTNDYYFDEDDEDED